MADSFNVVSARSSVTSRPELGQIDIAELGHIRSGQSAYDEGVGFWLGRILGVAKFSLGDSAGDKMTWDGNSLDITGTLTATTGVIGGFTIGATTISATNLTLDSSGQRISLGSANDIVILDADDATYRLWIGNSTAASAPFRVEKDGSLVATDATITGSITASTGTIGGFTIGATTLTGSNLILDSSGQRITLGTSNSVVILDADDATYRLWIGNATAASAPFRVTSAGAVTATSGTIGGFTLGSTTLTATNLTLDASGQRISLGSGNNIVIMDADEATYRLWVGNSTAASAPFRVEADGSLIATDATITGAITATSGSFTGTITSSAGTIGGFTLGASTLTATNLILDSSGQRITLGTSNSVVIMDADDATYRLWVGNATAASAPFRVTSGGALTATSATITGSITSTSGTIGGFTLGASTLTATNLILDSSGQRISLGSSNDIIIMDADDATYRLWIGHATAASAPFSVTKAGAATATNITITGGSVASNILSGLILQANLDVSNSGWTQTSVFSVTDADTVSWGAGTFTTANGTAYSIGAGNTGNMVAKTYIYLQPSVSTTAYQTTTTATTAMGAGKVLVAIAQNNTGEATFQVIGGQGGINIDASSIVAGSITANEIAASTITAGKLSVATLSAITADMGAITAGTITLNSSGHIKSGQTAFNTGEGFWLGFDSGIPRFSIGDSTSSGDKGFLAWTGSFLYLDGTIWSPNSFFQVRMTAGGLFAIDGSDVSFSGINTIEQVQTGDDIPLLHYIRNIGLNAPATVELKLATWEADTFISLYSGGAGGSPGVEYQLYNEYSTDNFYIRADEDPILTGTATGNFTITSGTATGQSPNTSVDNLVIDSTSSSGLSFLTSTSGSSFIFFGDTDSNSIGQIRYSHTFDALQFIVASNATFILDDKILNDDQAAYIEFSSTGSGIISINATSASGKAALFFFRCGDASANVTILSSIATVTGGTGTLAGTTGTDGHLTIRADTTNNRLYFENRTGATRSYSISRISGVGLVSGYTTV